MVLGFHDCLVARKEERLKSVCDSIGMNDDGWSSANFAQAAMNCFKVESDQTYSDAKAKCQSHNYSKSGFSASAMLMDLTWDNEAFFDEIKGETTVKKNGKFIICCMYVFFFLHPLDGLPEGVYWLPYIDPDDDGDFTPDPEITLTGQGISFTEKNNGSVDR